jgi:zinc-binding alcohol dehydrogenase/oxidoreductase
MKAVFFQGKDYPLIIKEIAKPKPTEKQVLVRLHYAGLNHRDYWIRTEQAQHFPEGIILGSDGSGVIEAVGEAVELWDEGQEVVINPSLKWGTNPVVQADAFKILGFPDHGTFSEYITISKDQIFEKPEHLSFAEAAALPLSGLTAYRALFTKARLRPGEKVLVTGIGGGSAQWVMTLALSFKARVFVTTGSESKLKKAIELGAAGGYNYNEPDWIERATREAGGFDVIVDSAGGRQFSELLKLAQPGGRVVIFGRTAGNIPGISPELLFRKQLTVFGTTMGSRDEFLSMLDFVAKHTLRPIVAETFPLEKAEDALRSLYTESRFGKVVLKISP